MSYYISGMNYAIRIAIRDEFTNITYTYIWKT